MSLKQDLRKDFLQRMSELSSGEVEDRSQSIAEKFFREFKLSAECMHVFLTITRNNELNTFLFINKILREHQEVKLAAPKADFSTGSMVHYRYNLDTQLKVNKLGIPEPFSGEQVDSSCFDIVLVPMLCFDKKGFRVGYGKGFYDRFLAQCRPETKKIGLCLFEPVEEISDVDAFDVKLDYCIDPNHVHKF